MSPSTPLPLFQDEMTNPKTGARATVRLDAPGDGRYVMTVKRYNASGVQTSVVMRSVCALYLTHRNEGES